MKLFVDAHLFDGAGQGTKTYLEGLYSDLIMTRSDINYTMAAVDTGKLKSFFGLYENLNFVPYRFHNRFARLALDIPTLLKKHKIDIAHFQYVSPLIKSCREVVTVHDILFLDYPQYFPLSYRLVKNTLFKRSAQRADWVATVSQFSKEALIRHYRIKEEKILITPNGVLDIFYDDKTTPPQRADFPVNPFILYVSRFEPRKNQHGLLQVYLDLQLWKKDIELVFIGTPGVHSPEFAALHENLSNDIKRHVRFFSDVSATELKEFYQKSLLTVYPSFAEGFGIPPLEAGVSGANVICSNATAMSEFTFFADRLFDPGNRDEFRDKISYYINHPPSSIETNFIRDSIRKKYNWRSSANTFSATTLAAS